MPYDIVLGGKRDEAMAQFQAQIEEKIGLFQGVPELGEGEVRSEADQAKFEEMHRFDEQHLEMLSNQQVQVETHVANWAAENDLIGINVQGSIAEVDGRMAIAEHCNVSIQHVE